MTAKSGRSPRKIEPLPGCLSATYQRCGKPSCRCARGQRHGPYWSRFWREGGRRRRAYVRPSDLAHVRAGLAEWRRLHPPVRSARQVLAELRRLFRQIERGEG
ncbi:MAG: hypothetical protein M3O34_14985 [Chloroflexota bacterium]|nr:hypothetical protein [Chloroflexota bacterium]